MAKRKKNTGKTEGRDEKGRFTESGNKEAQFSSTNQPASNGRPKKIYTILKESGFGADDIRTAFGEVAWYNLKDLQELYKKEDTPIILKIVANAYRMAAKDGKYQYVKEILEQYMGKPKQSIDLDAEFKATVTTYTIKPASEHKKEKDKSE